MYELALRSKLGGLSLGVQAVYPQSRTVCHVEGEAIFAAILAARMESGQLDHAPIWSYLPSFDGRPWREIVDLVSGTIHAGSDDVSQVTRIIESTDPSLCFFVSESRDELFELCDQLDARGFECAQNAFAAADIGAPVQQVRSFVVARAGNISLANRNAPKLPGAERFPADSSKCLGFPPGPDRPEAFASWVAEAGVQPLVPRGGDGLSNRMDRLYALRNALIPGLAAHAFVHLWEVLAASEQLRYELANRQAIVVH